MFTLSIGDPWNGMSLHTTKGQIVQWCLNWTSKNPKANIENLQIDDANGYRRYDLERKLLALLPQGSYAHA